MRVKIGTDWYSSDNIDICVEFNELELDQVKSMRPDVSPNRRFAVMQERGRTHEEMREWMRRDDDEKIE